MKSTTEPMDASQQFCPNEACSARGQIGAGNISIHGRKRPRYKCQSCGKTFSARKGTMLEGVRTDEEKVTLVVTLLSYGCPLQAIVHAFGLDERTEQHGKSVQESSANECIPLLWNKERSRANISKPMRYEQKGGSSLSG